MQSQSAVSLVPPSAPAMPRAASNLRETERDHAEPAGLHSRDRQRPRTGPPQRDVLHEQFTPFGQRAPTQ